jgi:predicted PurR-regulated permease PerM
MANNDSKTKGSFFSSLSNYFFLAFLIGVLYIFYLILRPFLTDIFVAIMITMIFYPLYKIILKRFRDQRVLAGLATTLIILIVFLMPIILLSGLIAGQSLELYKKISDGIASGSIKKALDLKFIYYSNLLERWHISLNYLQLETRLGNFLKNLSEFIYIGMTSVAKGALGALVNMIIVLFITFFLLIDGDKFLRELKALNPLEAVYLDRIVAHAERTIKATLKGSVIIAVVQGMLGGIGFWIFGLPSPAFWGACMVFSSVIPLVGTSIIWVPGVLFLALTDSLGPALGLAAWGTFVIAGADNVLRPLLLKGEAHIHPLLTFLSILGGITYFGFLGFILGPVVLSFLMTLFEIYKRDFVGEPQSGSDTN